MVSVLKRLALLTVSIFIIISLSSCGDKTVSGRLFVMDAVADISLNGTSADISEMEEILDNLGRTLSAYDGGLSSLNDAGKGNMSGDLRDILEKSEEYYNQTDGAFSPYLGSIIELWGVGSKNYVPTESEIQESLASCRAENVKVSGNTLLLENGVRLNFGAIAKGYASDILRDCLIKNKIPSAVISLGGNVYVHGKNGDKEWNVGIRDPRGSENDYMGIISLSDKFVISSGDYERYFEKDGKRYHHIMDAKTGRPCESDLLSAVVVSESGTMGDAFSTAVYIMGREKALEFWRRNNNFELILVGRDGKVTVTEGIYGKYVPNGEDYEYEIARR